MLLKFIKSLYLKPRFFWLIGGCIGLFIASFPFEGLFLLSKIVLLVLVLITFLDILLLFSRQNGLIGKRLIPDKLSNGDVNDILVEIENNYGFNVHLSIIDEVPAQFQMRDFLIEIQLPKKISKTIKYHLKPTKRGEYTFGALNLFAESVLGLVSKRYVFDQNKSVPVYPGFLQLRKYELMAISNRLTEFGIKKIRKIGHNREFEQIKEYVQGNDLRTINWKATARKQSLMVNHYQDEKSQQVYSVIDKGRLMKMPFEKMTLLDYAINASLVISKIALMKDDKAGLITFGSKMDTILPASKNNSQMSTILETLYNQKTAYKDASFEKLYINIKKRLNQRSLVLLYTNFESFSSMQRQLPYLRKIARNHLLVVIFFENTELKTLLEKESETLEEIYIQTIAEKIAHEKQMIAKELLKFGIQSVLTPPKNLTIDSINKYLELKARGMI